MSGKSSPRNGLVTSSSGAESTVFAASATINAIPTTNTHTNAAGGISGGAIGSTVSAVGSGGPCAIGPEGLSKKKRNVYERLGVNEIYNMVDEKSLQTKQEVVIIEGTYLLTNF